ncbi:alpha-aminoadipic semialdehyde synthase, mitochondrial-like [Ptychodera flava]|uniref:alpha-aminoadipic semialdehyde synthase, mitochondrial-like n=1 Tax=Ptychodera flava TaxID=63121 RepID=UPI003969E6AD
MWKNHTRCLYRTLATAAKRQAIRDFSQMSERSMVVGIRREDGSAWERRAPLGPNHVRELVDSGIKVLVQPSNRRAYPMQDYENHGAIIQEDLMESSVILGVKQVPEEKLIPNKSYAFFSHTIKAQKENMPLLDAMLEKNIRLVDYEKMVDSTGKRLVAFGKFAGIAGMINILHGLGLRLLALGHHTPFMHIGSAHNYRSSGMAKQAIRDAGYEIALGMMPKSLGPLTFVFTGSGNVSQGAQEIFTELPHRFVKPADLEYVAKYGDHKTIYATVINMEDHLLRKNGGGFSFSEFEEHPEIYTSNFNTRYAPWASVMVNGIYWAPNHPRLINNEDTKTLLSQHSSPSTETSAGCPGLPHRLLAICDISADLGGSVEFIEHATTIEAPFCMYDTSHKHEHFKSESFSGDGVLVCSIDNMPAQLPREATDFFGGLLLPYVKEMSSMDANIPLEREPHLSPVVRDAIICSNSELTPKYQYIQDLRRKQEQGRRAFKAPSISAWKKVLVLGAGYVSSPLVEFLTRDRNVSVTIGSAIRSEAEKLADKYQNTVAHDVDVQKHKGFLHKLVKDHDLVISLLPYSLHPTVLELCIKEKTNMVTASYVTPAMAELHQSAVDAGITVVNEVGVDPGIDHMLAMKCFHEAAAQGSTVNSFISYCGGLPAPEYSDNPLRYKFSWSPRGALLNTLSAAKYLKNGKVVQIPQGGALLDSVEDMDFLPGFNLEGFPNRDSTVYKEQYGIMSASTILRGTLRYKGYSSMMKGLQACGLISDQEHKALQPTAAMITWRDLMCVLLGQDANISTDSLMDLILERVDGNQKILDGIVRLQLLSNEVVLKRKTPLDTLSYFLDSHLSYGAGERDMIILRHDVGIVRPNDERLTHHIDMVIYGDPDGFSAMAKSVGLPCAIASRMVLDGEIDQKGMVKPFTKDIYQPILHTLIEEGITSTEHVEPH